MKSQISKPIHWVQQQFNFFEQAEMSQQIKVKVLEYKGPHTQAETKKYYGSNLHLQRPFNRVHPKENRGGTNDDDACELSGKPVF